MTWNDLSQLNQRGGLAATLVCLALLVVETVVDGAVALNVLQLLGRLVRG